MGSKYDDDGDFSTDAIMKMMGMNIKMADLYNKQSKYKSQIRRVGSKYDDDGDFSADAMMKMMADSMADPYDDDRDRDYEDDYKMPSGSPSDRGRHRRGRSPSPET